MFSVRKHITKALLQTRFYSAAARSKVYASPDEAVKDVKSGDLVLSGGFGICGIPDTLISALQKRGNVKDLTVVSNNCGIEGKGLSKLLENGQISKFIGSYVGGNKFFEAAYLNGELELELTPQGTIAERCRAAGAGIPAVYTPAGANTWLEQGKIPTLYAKTSDGSGAVIKTNTPRETREFNGRKFVLENALNGDVSLIKAWKADTLGNLVFRATSNNFNGAMARAGKLTIAEAEEIVEPGEIKPEEVHVPGVYVHRVVKSTAKKDIEIVKNSSPKSSDGAADPASMSASALRREKIVRRAAQEFKDGMFANLGIGMPTLAPNHVSDDIHVILQSENGILGLGPYPEPGKEDPDYINAGKETVTLDKGASVFGSEESFAMIRAGKIDMSILGAMQVSGNGDLANWALPGMIKGMGGAMDLVANPLNTRVVVVMDHVDKKGRPKILKECQFPLTGSRCVSRIITDLAVFDVDIANNGGLTLIEIAEGETVESIREKTEAPFEVSKDLKTIDVL
ncbi:hypothetical protein B0I72DRAFT_132719 [Yarrowia lipolytica]|jgi:3-oxoacid CoA-transferase|uniref:Succinyl-CoA:3-ketoacid-coenzyme A transferase n=2 Tax=Yarrowia lipolytica TaxID=4952 RepID=Q6C098_YARLI|nr:YALI0F26587p [Yarrowia lipolytica CLIB122]AOW07747.1 hypothetical protein YALI1_F34029g [Yarrowia lipolytica]KAB8284548.1 hypothetical protein BKA91DRAFT_134984 [Yarrowia lipolytica]KAE8174411.1 hypothetical protein BKA90DRAFT_133926 [Yarrowia lipolytica]KAJ8055201.1 hypothetical protein LXG23DRAFT_18226 [Yarrowia lipolytica]QNP99660.1 Putative succinyl-CoA:3-ketoacid coenzyme A transferase [Yarrowia lipolytica]|eukprot:XP_505914.1 YALI0F26587p [Yarrowia lipolytica CLIB122]